MDEVRRIGLEGRRTGVTVRKSITKDDDGFEDLEEFFDIGSPAARSGRSPRKRTPEYARSRRAVSPAGMAAPPPVDDYDDYPQDDYGYGYGDEDPETPQPRPKPAPRRNQKKKVAARKAPSKPKAAPKKRRVVTPQEPESEDENFAKLDPDDIEAGGLRKAALVSPDATQQTPGARRSRRRRVEPLAFWKNERMLYERSAEDMLPTVTARAVAPKTPAQYKRKAAPKKRGGAKAVKKQEEVVVREVVVSAGGAVAKPFPKKRLPKSYTYNDDDGWAVVWDEVQMQATEQRIVTFASMMKQTELPVTAKRPKSKQGVGLAAQAFNTPEVPGHMPGWISGQVVLPPQAIKDAEGVGVCAQVFSVAAGQPKALEFSLALPEEPGFNPETAQRYLLSPGDQFLVPPNNIYRLENHSDVADAVVSWTIIKPLGDGVGVDEDDDDEDDI